MRFKIITWVLTAAMLLADADVVTAKSVPVRSGAVKSVAVKEDVVKEEAVKEDAVKSVAVKKDDVKKDPVKKDPVKSASPDGDLYNQARHDYFFHEAVRQSASQNLAESFELFRYCIAADSASSTSKYQLAQLYMVLNDKVKPDLLLRQAIAEDSTNFWYRRMLAVHYKRTHRQPLAIREYEEMVRLFPQHSDVLLELAEMYDEMGEYRKELNSINRYGVLEDVTDQLSNQRFLCYLRMELLDSAYYEVRNSEAETMEALLSSINNANGADLVLRFCSVVEKHRPDIWQAYHNQSIINYQLKNTNEAFEIIDRGLRCIKDSLGLSSLYSLRGEYHHDMNRMDLTYADYDSALIYNPKDINILNNYAYFLSLENRDLTRAASMSLQTIQSEPSNATYLDTYAWILFKLKKFDEALIYISAAMENGGRENADVVEHCGDIYFHCGEKQKALEYWHAAVRLNSSSVLLDQKIRQEKYIE